MLPSDVVMICSQNSGYWDTHLEHSSLSVVVEWFLVLCGTPDVNVVLRDWEHDSQLRHLQVLFVVGGIVHPSCLLLAALLRKFYFTSVVTTAVPKKTPVHPHQPLAWAKESTPASHSCVMWKVKECQSYQEAANRGLSTMGLFFFL